MPSSIAHASVAVLLAPLFGRDTVDRRTTMTAAAAAAIPDLDAIGRPFGLGDVTWLGGHRAFTHSIVFALVAGILAAVWSRRGAWRHARKIGLYVGLVVLSHGVLDAFTTYGEGVSFLAPFSMIRWKSAWQPLSGLLPEVLLLWLPALLVYRMRRRARLALDPRRTHST